MRFRTCLNLLVLAGCILTACTKNDVDRMPMGQMDITAVIGQPLTKTLVASDPQGGEELVVKWAAGDRIGVFGSKAINACFVNKASEPAVEASFSGRFPEGDAPVLAYYPFVEAAGDKKAVPVTIPETQTYDGPSSIASYDFKVGTVTGTGSDSEPVFSFNSVGSVLKISVRNLSALDGVSDAEAIRSISIDDASGCALTGSYKMNISSGALSSVATSASSSLTVVPSSFPAYAVVAPVVKAGDRLDITVVTSGHIIMFRKSARADFAPGFYYDVDIDMSQLSAEDDGLLVEAQAVTTRFASFGFAVADNPDKILAKEVYYNGSKTVTRAVTAQNLDIDSEGNVSGCIPYLYDFNLVPSFTLDDAGDYDVYVGSELQTSGESEQDFSAPVTYRIVDRNTRASSMFTVSLSNTGLPVMVINQKSSYPSTVAFLDMRVPAKSSDFGVEDEIAIYEHGVATLPLTTGGYRLRGNITQGYPKKPFAVKLSSKASVLGMAKHKRWCLLANWKDNTNLRNDLTQMLAREMTGEWQPNGEFVELVLNGEHIGLYYLCEQIKIDKNRLAIQKNYEDRRDDYALDPSANPEPSFSNCGFLIEFDNYFDELYKFRINGDSYLPVNCKDDFDDSPLGQSIFSQLQARMTSIDNYIDAGNFSAAYDLLDKTSAANFMLVMELAMNNEYKHPRSVCAYMDGGDDKLHFGPCWDFDTWTYPVISNMTYYNSETYVHSYNAFQFQTEVMNRSTNYVWFKQLARDAEFAAEVRARWSAFQSNPAVTPQAVAAYIDARVMKISTSVEYDRGMWPHPSQEHFDDWMNADETTGSRGSGAMRSYEETISLLKQAYSSRYNGLTTAVNAM